MAQARSIRWPALLLAFGVAATWVVLSRIGPEEEAQPPRRIELGPPVEAKELEADLERDDTRVAIASNPAKSGPTVSLIDAATKAPVVGARVRWVDGRIAEDVGGFVFEGDHAQLAQWIDEHGRDLSPAEDGRVALPWTDTIALVEASHGELEGRLELTPKAEGECVLELGPSRDLHVRVVDAAGVAVEGIEVGVFEESARLAPRRVGETDRSGIARIRDAAEFLGSGHVRVSGVFEVSHLLASEFLRPRRDPLELRLPPTGRVRVVIEEPLPSVGRASLSRAEFGRAREIPQIAEVSSSEAVFERVGLGLELQLSVDLDDEGESRAHAFVGPKVEGEEVRFVVGAKDRPAIVFRVLAADGVPLASSEVRLDLLASAQMRGEFADEVVTSAEGRVRRALPQFAKAAEGRALRIAHLESRTYAELELTRAYPGGDTDLGDVRLAPIPVLAVGRVVDDLGAPVHFASVVVETAGSGGGVGSDRRPDDWLAGKRKYTTSARDGTFELRMPPLRHAVALRVMKGPGYFTVPALAIQPGQTGIEIVLRRAASVEGRVLRPNELADAQLMVGMEPIEVEGEVLEPRNTALLSGGSFRVGSVALGRWRLRVGQAEDMPVFQKEIEVTPGRNVVETIDLRAVLRPIAIEVVDGQSREFSDVDVGLAARHSGSSAWSRVRRRSMTSFVVLTDDSAIDVFVHAPGHEAQWILGATADQRVVLRRGIPVRIAVRGEAPLSDGNLNLSARLIPLDHDVPSHLLTGCAIEGEYLGTREFTGFPQLSGRHAVEWSATLGPGGLDGPRSHLLESHAEVVEVPKGESVAPIEITAPTDGLEQARAAQLPKGTRRSLQPR